MRGGRGGEDDDSWRAGASVGEEVSAVLAAAPGAPFPAGGRAKAGGSWQGAGARTEAPRCGPCARRPGCSAPHCGSLESPRAPAAISTSNPLGRSARSGVRRSWRPRAPAGDSVLQAGAWELRARLREAARQASALGPRGRALSCSLHTRLRSSVGLCPGPEGPRTPRPAPAHQKGTSVRGAARRCRAVVRGLQPAGPAPRKGLSLPPRGACRLSSFRSEVSPGAGPPRGPRLCPRPSTNTAAGGERRHPGRGRGCRADRRRWGGLPSTPRSQTSREASKAACQCGPAPASAGLCGATGGCARPPGSERRSWRLRLVGSNRFPPC